MHYRAASAKAPGERPGISGVALEQAAADVLAELAITLPLFLVEELIGGALVGKSGFSV